jgi:pimeloyl-ACP methyl ester carboxylesterase
MQKKSGLITRQLSLLILLLINAAAFAQKPTYLIVHGAWGGGWAFKQVDALLTAQGSEVYRPSLTGQGERAHLSSADINLNTHIQDVVNVILYENLQDIILVGHSYGGMVITGVADSIPDRIRKLVYLDAFVPNDGESLVTSKGNDNSGPERNAKNGMVVPTWVKEDQQPPKDVPQSLKTFTQPVSRKNPKALKLPATYILTVDKGAKAENDTFFMFAQRAQLRGWKTVTLIADHNPHWSNVNELVKLLGDEK